MIEVVRMEGSTFLPPPQRFEPGVPAIAEAAGLAAAVDYLTALGMDNVAAHEESLTAHALDALREIGGVQGVPELVEALGRNPLPDGFVVSTVNESVEPLAAELAKLPGVAHVQADALWARRLSSLARLGRAALWLLAGLLAAALVAVTFNTIRLQILTQREEIEVSKLLGATDSFVRRPFYYTGLLLGVAGGAIALALVYGSLALLNRQIAPLAATYGSDFRLAFLSNADTVAVLGLAGSLGWLGAHLSVGRHLLDL
jgi:cell division transport system permease protein